MHCPSCNKEGAQVLFNLTECTNKECKNYSYNYEKELENKFKLTEKENEDLDQELDEAFQFTFGWTGFGC